MPLFRIRGISKYPLHFLDNEHILIESGSCFSYLNITNGEQSYALSLAEFDSVSCIASNESTRILVIAIEEQRGSRLEVYSFDDIDDLKLLHVFKECSPMGYSHIDISNDGDYMIAVSNIPDLEIEFWSISKKLKLASTNVQCDDIKYVSFSPTSYDLFMSANTNSVILWRVYYKFDQYFLTSTIHSLHPYMYRYNSTISLRYITAITFGERGNEIIYCNNLGEMVVFDETTRATPKVIHKLRPKKPVFKLLKLLFTRFYYVLVFAHPDRSIIEFISRRTLQTTHQYAMDCCIKHCVLSPDYQQLLIVNQEYEFVNCFIRNLTSIKHHTICGLTRIEPRLLRNDALNVVSLRNDGIEYVLLQSVNKIEIIREKHKTAFDYQNVSTMEACHYQNGIDIIALGFDDGHIGLCCAQNLNLKLFFAERLFEHSVTQIAFHSNGSLIACMSSYDANIWFIEIVGNAIPKVLGYCTLNKKPICCCWGLNKMMMVVAFECGVVAMLNVISLESNTLSLESRSVECEVDFSPQKLVCGRDRVFCVTQNNELRAFLLDDDGTLFPDDTFMSHIEVESARERITHIAVYGDLLLTSAHNGMIKIRYISEPRNVVLSFYAHTACTKGVCAAQFVANGSTVVSVGYDASLLLWQIDIAVDVAPLPLSPWSIGYLNDLEQVIIKEQSVRFEERIKSERMEREKHAFEPTIRGIKSELDALHQNYRRIIECVTNAPHLDEVDIIVDHEQYHILLQQNKEEIGQIQESTKHTNIGKQLITRRIREQCCDKMAHKLQVVTAIKSNAKVSTFPIVSHHKHDVQLMQKVEFLRKMNILEQKWSIKSQDRVCGVGVGVGVELDSNLELEITHPVSDQCIHYIWDVNEEERTVPQSLKHVLYHPMALYTNYRKRIQIDLLNLRMRETKRRFNGEVHHLLKLKKNEIERMHEMLLEIADIEKELEIESDAVFVYSLDKRDDEEHQQDEQMEANADEANDDAQRALYEMMHNTLESKDEVERLQDTLKKPAFMDKIEAPKYNEEQRYQVAKYTQKKEALTKAKEIRRKLLRTQLKALTNDVTEIYVSFDDTLSALYRIGLGVMKGIYVHELMVMHLTNHIMRNEEHRKRIHNMDLELIRLKQDKEKADSTYLEFNEKLEESKRKLSELLAADKQADKTFKKEMQVSKEHYEYLYSMYRTKEEQEQEEEQAEEEQEEEQGVILNPYIEEETKKKEKKTEKKKKKKRKHAKKPSDLSNSIWNRFLSLKQFAITNDSSISCISDEIISMEAEVNALTSNQCIILESIDDIEREKEILNARRNKYQLNVELFLCPKQGNVEVNECPVVTDMRESVLCDRNVITHLNDVILNAATQHIERLNEMKRFRRGINALKWKAKILDLEHQYYTLLTSEYQLRRVTKKEQEIIRSGGHSYKQKNEVCSLEKKLQFTKNTIHYNIEEKKGLVKKYKMKMKNMSKANHHLLKEIERLQRDLNSKQDIVHIRRALSMKQEKKQIAKAQMETVVTARKLVDLVKAQSQEIQFLRNRLDQLRRSTFPSFSISPTKQN